jgi:hypothetical protein
MAAWTVSRSAVCRDRPLAAQRYLPRVLTFGVMRNKMLPVVIAADPFLLPTKEFPSSICPEEQQRLSKAITEAVANEVLPA